MKSLLSTKSAAAITASLPAMEGVRQTLSARIGAYMSRGAACDARGGQLAGSAITSFLFEQANQLATSPHAPRARQTEPRLRIMNLPKRSLSCFGDGLGAVMKDLLRAQATPAVLAAWGDLYWASMRAAADQERLLAA